MGKYRIQHEKNKIELSFIRRGGKVWKTLREDTTILGMFVFIGFVLDLFLIEFFLDLFHFIVAK